jgi:hypothetical protein
MLEEEAKRIQSHRAPIADEHAPPATIVYHSTE